MTSKPLNLNRTKTPDVLVELERRHRAAEEAQAALNNYVEALVRSKHWEQISYNELALALRCSRQAVQQRVARLLAGSKGGRKVLAAGDHPGQTKIPLS